MSQTIKLVGRTTDFSGKTLWELVGNLRNHGVGRYVKRSMFERYPEPSFMKIVRVEALPVPEKVMSDQMVLVLKAATLHSLNTSNRSLLRRATAKSASLSRRPSAVARSRNSSRSAAPHTRPTISSFRANWRPPSAVPRAPPVRSAFCRRPSRCRRCCASSSSARRA